MCLQFGFVIFWQKDFGAKAAHKMLVKMTPGLLLPTAKPVLITDTANTAKIFTVAVTAILVMTPCQSNVAF